MPEQDDRDDERLEDLEERMAVLEGFQENIVKQQMMSRLDDLEQAVARIDELEQENQQLRAMVQDLKGQLETVSDLAEDQQTTPEKRAADVRSALIRRAKARADGENRAAMHYQDVMDALADLGHGSLHKPQAFDAMEDAAEGEGFSMGTKAKNGNQVKAVRVDLDALPAHVASNEINTGEMVSGSQNTPNTAD